jgi:homoserine dehydrogenase
MDMRVVKIGILGMGTVGSGVYKVLASEGEYIAHKEGIQIEVKKVLALNYSIEIPEEKKAKNIEELANDPEIEIVVEVMGGIEPAKSFILKMFKAGKSVVSANKQLIANHWAELEQGAKETGAGFYFEASVGGGIPILRTIEDSLQANTISSIYAIINGTTNYILTKMSFEGGEYEDVLKEAQRLGYAEANPTADVDGYDAMYKLSILASIAFHARLPIDYIYREGIRSITKMDIGYARELGYAIKLLAIAIRRGNDVELRVHPTMIPLSNPLANVRDSFNAILLNGSAVGDVMFYGRGAGDMPTASAIISDIIYAAVSPRQKYATFENYDGKVSPILHFEKNWETAYYIRLNLLDKLLLVLTLPDVFFGINHQQVFARNPSEPVAQRIR